MSNAIPSRPGLKQGGADTTELFLSLFGGEVLTAFHGKSLLRDKHFVKSLAKGAEFRFPAIWQAAASYHTPGTELLGAAIDHTEIIIVPDDKLIAQTFIADIDEVLNHYDVRGPYATELGQALAKHYDKNVLRSILKAARSGALFTGDQGGSALVKATAASDASALFDALSDGKLAMEEKDVPVDDQPVYAMLAPLQYSMLARSDKNLNRDYNGGSADVRNQSFSTWDGINVLKSTNAKSVFGVNDTANANIPSRYRANFSTTVAALWTPYAVATAEVMGVTTESEYTVSKQGTLMVAKMAVGTDTLRSKCAVEIKTA